MRLKVLKHNLGNVAKIDIILVFIENKNKISRGDIMKNRAILLIFTAILMIFVETQCYAYEFLYRWSTLGLSDKSYYVSTGFSSDERSAINASSSTWNNVSDTDFDYIYNMASFNITNTYLNYENTVFKSNLGSNAALALCYISTSIWGKIVDADIAVNYDYSWSSNGDSNKFDIQNVVTHEIGHALFSADIYYASQVGNYYADYKEVTMYGYVSLGETKKRTLHQDDIDGWVAAY